MNNKFIFSLKASIILIFLVIAAGATVRMTGSGMGCPDWPKCFGYLIPPTERVQLEWKSSFSYNKNEIIIVNESLRIAKNDFISGDVFNEYNWAPYLKHDYAIFNAYHTWIEFINRLIGVIAGIATLSMLFFSISYWKKNKIIVLVSLLVVIGMGFQAWLGKEVVDSNLLPLKITIHMMGSFIIIALLLYAIYHSQPKNLKPQKVIIFPPVFKYVLISAISLTFIQVFLGTQVRQFIDEQVLNFGYKKELWLQNPNLQFYIHRTLSILIILINASLYMIIKKIQLNEPLINYIILVIGLEVVTGILMYYLNFPFTTQPLHLVLSALLFGLQFYLILKTIIKKA